MRSRRTGMFVGVIRGYQRWISPLLGQHCRFAPSCSHYAIDALQAHGLVRGSGLAVRRVLRCHPWNLGGYDPVPRPSRASATIEGVASTPDPRLRRTGALQ